MEINALESQLSNIVDSTAAISQSKSKPETEPEINSAASQVSEIVSKELEVYHLFKKEGRELEYLEGHTQSMNSFFKELNLNVNFKVESSEVGYVVKVMDENGEVVKMIPSEQVVQTRQNIREMIKGIFEDKSR